MPDAAYYREYRARRKAEGRPVDAKRDRSRASRSPEDRRREYAQRASRAAPPLPQLYEELRHGRSLSFWEDELKMDLAQERQLAILEGRDPDAAVKAYKARELNWRGHVAPLIETSHTSPVDIADDAA